MRSKILHHADGLADNRSCLGSVCRTRVAACNACSDFFAESLTRAAIGLDPEPGAYHYVNDP